MLLSFLLLREYGFKHFFKIDIQQTGVCPSVSILSVSLSATHSSCHISLIVTCVFGSLLDLILFVIWAFLSFGVFLSLGCFCHLGLLATWVFLSL